MKEEIEKTRKLVGAIRKEQLRYVDSYVGEDIVLFMPTAGACFYALTPEHSHPSYMFVLAFNNQTSFQIKNKILSAVPGRVFALSPDIVHHELPSDSPPRYIAVFINKDLFEKQLSQYPSGTNLILNGEFYNIEHALHPLLKRFMIEADNDLPGSGSILHALSIEICHCLIRGILNINSTRDRVSSRMEIDRVIEYLHSHLDKKISIDEASKIAYMSPSHFSRIFKKETGMSLMNYLNKIRMDRVKKLLLGEDASITEVALACGFNSPSYLSACFNKEFKMSPSEYKKSISDKT